MKTIEKKKNVYIITITLIFMFLVLTFLGGCSSSPTKPVPPTTPVITPPPSPVTPSDTPKLGMSIRLWSTYYFTPQFDSIESGYFLRGKDNLTIGGPLSLDFWCFIGLQGTGAVDGVVYTYQTQTSSHRVPCEKSFMRSLRYAKATGRIKYYKDVNKYGSGNRNNPLKPFKSIACDQRVFKYGQRFFVPDFKDVTLPNGEVHNGIIICEDVGGAVKGNHIDLFIGFVNLNKENFRRRYSVAFSKFPEAFKKLVKSSSSHTFKAYIVKE